MRRLWLALLLALVLWLAATPALAQIPQTPRTAGPPTAFADFPIPSGRFYSQASGRDKAFGYSVVDDGGVAFWREFQRLGAVGALGCPPTPRFRPGGLRHPAHP